MLSWFRRRSVSRDAYDWAYAHMKEFESQVIELQGRLNESHDGWNKAAFERNKVDRELATVTTALNAQAASDLKIIEGLCEKCATALDANKRLLEESYEARQQRDEAKALLKSCEETIAFQRESAIKERNEAAGLAEKLRGDLDNCARSCKWKLDDANTVIATLKRKQAQLVEAALDLATDANNGECVICHELRCQCGEDAPSVKYTWHPPSSVNSEGI